MHWGRFVLLYGLQIAVTQRAHFTTCRDSSTQGLALYAIHHALDVYLFWAPLFLVTSAEWRAYTAVAVTMLAHWATFRNRCIATVLMNRWCGFPESRSLDSLKNRIGISPTWAPFHYAWIGAVLVYAIAASSDKN